MKSLKKIIDINFTHFDGISQKKLYQTGALGCLVGHVIYVIMFHIMGVTIMERYNYFSVAFYVCLLFFITKSESSMDKFVYYALAEIVVHACLGIYCTGWGKGFAMFMLFIVPIPFYMPLKKWLLPYLLSFVDMVIFVVMKLFMTGREGVYTLESDALENTVYLINMLFGFIIILYISSIYMFGREITNYKITAKNESLQKLASVDPLTQLFNRRAMMDFLRMIQNTSAQAGKSYVIGLGDVDDFKHVNDTYGHYTGDEVLRRASKIMAECVPSEGYICRWGGEEFLFAVPSSDCAAGVRYADKIRTRIGSEVFHTDKGDFSVTLTMGVCEVAAGEDFEHYITVADNRLYKGKTSGKNCVVAED
ncbi:MAG: GGDEF domain-containing protein [Ruminococcus sp.]|nr:GGDEF domain-containing protein [Ruminococcus sp.]